MSHPLCDGAAAALPPQEAPLSCDYEKYKRKAARAAARDGRYNFVIFCNAQSLHRLTHAAMSFLYRLSSRASSRHLAPLAVPSSVLCILRRLLSTSPLPGDADVALLLEQALRTVSRPEAATATRPLAQEARPACSVRHLPP